MSKLENDEVVLYEGNIKFAGKAGKLILTNKNIIFQQEKGLFKKSFKDVKKVLISNIKMFDNNVSIKQENKAVTMQTTDGDISFESDNIFELGKIINKIKELRTGSGLLGRVANKAKDKYDKLAGGLVGTAVSAGAAWAIRHPGKVKKGLKVAIDAAKTIITKK